MVVEMKAVVVQMAVVTMVVVPKEAARVEVKVMIAPVMTARRVMPKMILQLRHAPGDWQRPH